MQCISFTFKAAALFLLLLLLLRLHRVLPFTCGWSLQETG